MSDSFTAPRKNQLHSVYELEPNAKLVDEVLDAVSDLEGLPPDTENIRQEVFEAITQEQGRMIVQVWGITAVITPDELRLYDQRE